MAHNPEPVTLVLGGSGFLGRQIVNLLVARKAPTIAVSRHATTANACPTATTLRMIDADLMAPSALTTLLAEQCIDRVIDTAWLPASPDLMQDPRNTLAADAMIRRWETCMSFGVTRWLGVGSCAEYDWNTGIALAEDDPCYPATPYGRAKLRVAVETQGSPSAVTSTWVRPFFIYGPGEPPHKLIPSLARMSDNGEIASLRNADLSIDFVHVIDVARAVIELLDGTGGQFNICTGTATPIRQIANWVRAGKGLQAEQQHDHSTPSLSARKILGSIRRLNEALHWAPDPICANTVRDQVQQILTPEPPIEKPE